jgi:hypothetical protein
MWLPEHIMDQIFAKLGKAWVQHIGNRHIAIQFPKLHSNDNNLTYHLSIYYISNPNIGVLISSTNGQVFKWEISILVL